MEHVRPLLSDVDLPRQHAQHAARADQDDINKTGDGSEPTIRLNGKAFALHTREDHPLGTQAPLMHLPRRDGYSGTEALGRTSFLRPEHSLLRASMNRANGARMLRNAGMTRGDMGAFLKHHGDHSFGFPKGTSWGWNTTRTSRS